MSIVQVIIDDTASKVITGTYEFDRVAGGTLLVPSGTSFPGTPAAKELFWRTDEAKLYRRSDANDAWVAVTAVPASHASTHQPGGGDAMAVDAAASTGSLRTVGTGALQACAGNDSRLSDARTPTAHKTSHEPGGGDALAVDAVAGTGSLRTLGTGATAACAGNDSRLSDARTPTAHAASHQPGGSDAMTVDAVAGTGSLRTLGTAATAACAGNDSRLSDARTPTAHATSHKSGGADAVKLDELAAPTDVTTLDADLTKHGLLPKLGGGTANFLRADGTWAAPSGSVFGADPQIGVSEGTSTTTSSTMQDKVTLTTPALTGTYRVSFFCEIMIGNANARHQCRLYNVTDAAELCFDDTRPSLASMYAARGGFQYVTFSGAAKTFKIQFASQGGSATVTIRRARLELWRVS